MSENQSDTGSVVKKDTVYGIVIVALVALLVLSVLTRGFGLLPVEQVAPVNTQQNNTQITNNTGTVTTKPLVQLFTMAYCPYGNQAEEGIKPAVELLGNKIQFEPHYVIYPNYGGEGYCIENGAYCSMHGVQEINQDMRELCVWKNDNSKYWPFVLAMNSQCNSKNADTCWESVAQGLGIDTTKVKSCQTSQSATMAAAELALNGKYGVQGSPTLVIDGQEVQPNSRTPEGFKQTICNAFGSNKPSECNTALSGGGGTAPAGGCGS